MLPTNHVAPKSHRLVILLLSWSIASGLKLWFFDPCFVWSSRKICHDLHSREHCGACWHVLLGWSQKADTKDVGQESGACICDFHQCNVAYTGRSRGSPIPWTGFADLEFGDLAMDVFGMVHAVLHPLWSEDGVETTWEVL